MNIVFSDNPEESTKIPAMRLAEIWFFSGADGVVWIPRGMDAVTSERVLCVCAKTRDGRNCLRIYPLEPRRSPSPPAAVVMDGHPWVQSPTTHVLLRFAPYAIVRPLELVERSAREAVLMRDPGAPYRVRTFVRHVAAVGLVAPEEMREIAHLLEQLEAMQDGIRHEINAIILRYVSDLVQIRMQSVETIRTTRGLSRREFDVAEAPRLYSRRSPRETF